MTRIFLQPKRPEWFRRTIVLGAIAVALYEAAAWWSPWAPGRFGGLVAGTLASLLFVVEGLYPLRARLSGWPFRTAQHWLQFHIYGGSIACLLVLVHMSVRWPGGLFGWSLLLLTLWTTASGMAGVLLQKWIPTLIVDGLRVEAIYERIPQLVKVLRERADFVSVGASEMLARTCEGEVKPQLVAAMPSWSYLFDLRGARDRRLAPLEYVAQFLGEADRERLVDLEGIVEEKIELDAHLSLQRALRVWTVLHVPPAMLLIGLTAVHIVAVLWL